MSEYVMSNREMTIQCDATKTCVTTGTEVAGDWQVAHTWWSKCSLYRKLLAFQIGIESVGWVSLLRLL